MTRRQIPELKAFVIKSVDAMIEKNQKDIVIDLADHFFKTYAKEAKDFDEFLLHLSQKAFENGSEDRRYTFALSVIKSVGKDGQQLTLALAEAYKKHEQYLKAYIYFIAGDKPLEVVELMQKHILLMGYKTEKNLFIL